MATLIAEPLTAAAFAPFGDVLELPPEPGRHYIEAALGNARPRAPASLSLVRSGPPAGLPLEAMLMERHPFSSQSFIPLGAFRWLVTVAPHGPGGGPDTRAARAFLARPGQGITYRMDIWHHPLTVLDADAAFAVLMWRDGTSDDEEFVTLDQPFEVALG